MKKWKLNFDLYRFEVKNCAENLWDIKYGVLRRPHEGNGPQVIWAQGQILEEKEHATLLCSLRAHWRGKVHRQGWTIEQQEEYLTKNEEKFAHLIAPEEEEQAEVAEAVNVTAA